MVSTLKSHWQARHTAPLRSIMAVMIFAAATLATGQARAFPDGPITILVPFAPGGSTDIAARTIAEPVGITVGTRVIVENRPGANTQIATSAVIRAKPDGQTLLMGTTSLVSNLLLYPNLPYVASRDLRPVSLVVDTPAFLAVGSALASVKNAQDFLREARRSEGKWNYASPGTGSAPHLASEWLLDTVGFKAQHIPQKGSGPAVIAIASGEVQFSMENYPPAKPLIESGKMRFLAIAAPKRFPDLPNVPTFKEIGLGDVDLSSWIGLLAPAATPESTALQLNRAVNDALKRPEIRASLLKLGSFPSGGSPDDMLTRMAQDTGKWGQVVRKAKVTAE